MAPWIVRLRGSARTRGLGHALPAPALEIGMPGGWRDDHAARRLELAEAGGEQRIDRGPALAVQVAAVEERGIAHTVQPAGSLDPGQRLFEGGQLAQRCRLRSQQHRQGAKMGLHLPIFLMR